VNGSTQAALATAGLPSVNATIKFGDEVEGRARYDSYERDKTNLALRSGEVTIFDARRLQSSLSIERNGFELVDHRSEWALTSDLDLLDREYHVEMAELIRKISGTQHVLPQRSGLLLRRSDGSTLEKVAKPAGFAHLDYTEQSATLTADLVRQAEDVNGEIPPGAPFVIFQTWRVTSEPEHTTVLAVCDGTTVHEPYWILADSVIGPEDVPGNKLELRLGKPSPDQNWFWFSRMTSSEVLLFNGFDSRRPNEVNVLHTSFRVPDPDGTAHPRASIEARFVAYYV
jgi:hypothetical protein